MKRILPLLLCLFVCPVFAAAPKPLLFTDVDLIDGTGSAAQRDMTIELDGRRITAVYPSGSRPTPKHAQVQDLTGKYVIPGLIDAHVHITRRRTRRCALQGLPARVVAGWRDRDPRHGR